jgi:hypothetical protein
MLWMRSQNQKMIANAHTGILDKSLGIFDDVIYYPLAFYGRKIAPRMKLMPLPGFGLH